MPYVKNNFALDKEEYRDGVICIAATVFNHKGTVEYSIGISGAKEQREPKLNKLTDIIIDASREASRLLGNPENKSN